MIGILVVTHGRVAEELVNATRNIVGEIPAIAAVSIGWSDDPARGERGDRARAGGGRRHRPGADGHVRRHADQPQPAVPVGARRDRDRRQPADADQGLRRCARASCSRSPARCASRARERSTWRARSWSSGRRDPARARDPEPARAARARGRALRAHRERASARGSRPGRDGRMMDGKSILGILLLAASQGTSVEVIVDGPDEEQAMAALRGARGWRASGRSREHAARQRRLAGHRRRPRRW